MNRSEEKRLPQYLAYWGLKFAPFSESGSNMSFYLPPSQKSIRESLLLTCEKDPNLILLDSPPGQGKSTIAYWLYKTLPVESHEVIFLSLLSAKRDEEWFWSKIAQYFGIREEEKQESLQLIIDEIWSENRKLTVIIDSADCLKTAESLGEMIYLLNAQSTLGIVINIVLIGTSDWIKWLLDHEVFSHLVSFRATLPRLNAQEIREYIDFSLENSGLKETPFNASAYGKIVSLSMGNYARINALAEASLSEAFLLGVKIIDSAVVVKSDLKNMRKPHQTPSGIENTGALVENKIDLEFAKEEVKVEEQHEDELSSLFYSEENPD